MQGTCVCNTYKMEYDKINNLLGSECENLSKFVTRVYLIQQVLQENEDLIQQINFIGRLTEAANIFIIIKKKEHTILEFSQNFANILHK